MLAGSSPEKLLNRLLFTMGCHAGLAVPDAYVPGTGSDVATLRLDWAQALSQAKVAVYVANTGFGIGDTSSVAYSERLMGLYAKLLDGSLSVGQALAYAKQAYYGSLGAVGVYDFKILQQTAFYGLPFWRVSTTGIPPVPGRAAAARHDRRRRPDRAAGDELLALAELRGGSFQPARPLLDRERVRPAGHPLPPDHAAA